MNFDFITERIAVGQKIDSQEFCDALKAAGITAVINLFSGNPEPFWNAPSLTLAHDDDGTPRPVEQVRSGVAFGLTCLANRGKLYIHCQWGLGRAPTMCYAILRAMGLSQSEAIAKIESGRPRCASWNWKQYIPSVEVAL